MTKTHKIQLVSKIFRWLFIFFFVTILASSIWFWVGAPKAVGFPSIGLVLQYWPYHIPLLHTLSPMEKFIGFLIQALPMFINLFILYCLIRLFRLYEERVFFEMDNVRYIKRIGFALLIGQLLINPITEFLLSFAMTFHNPPGHRIAFVSFSGTNAGIVMASILIILISWIMSEGHKLNEEQQYTV